MNAREQILTSILDLKRRSDLYLNPPRLSSEQQKEFDSMMARLNSGEPLQYILGHTEFFGLHLKVDSRVLIPRPETEILVEWAIEELKDVKSPRILDIGTGSGNIAIALAKNLGGARVTTIDCSQAAQQLAQDNAMANGIKLNFIHTDMSDFLAENSSFDLIISNPPYISSNQLNTLPQDVQKEPKIALDGGVDGLEFYRVIIQKSCVLLKANGLLMMEIGDGQRDAVEDLLKAQEQFTEVKFYKDYVGTERIAIGCKL